MDMTTTSARILEHAVEPFSLKDAPALIEQLWPAQKISAEAQKERKANLGQTLTALGSYWKGRKPLILVRACVFGALLPVSENKEEDLAVFEALMRIDDEAFLYRAPVGAGDIAKTLVQQNKISAEELTASFQIKRSKASLGLPCPYKNEISAAALAGKVAWADDVSEEHRDAITLTYNQCFSYVENVARAKRPEELEEDAYLPIWDRVNRHLGTRAFTLTDLVEQLGIMRYGRRPRVADTFAGGGSIPFEAARIGCDVYASDLNPIACMLTWGALNIIGASSERRTEIEQAQREVSQAVDAEITRLGFERDEIGNRAKAYLYCLETKCPSSGWMVPMLPSLVVSKTRNVRLNLVRDATNKRYDIVVESGVNAAAMKQADTGTVRDGYLVHFVDGTEHRNSVKAIRGDYRRENGTMGNRLRLWEKSDFVPRDGDIFQERLYCIQWITHDSADKARPETFFAAPTAADLRRELGVIQYLQANFSEWQTHGLVPDMPIASGYNTDQPIRERGWTYWHHLFNHRQILLMALAKEKGMRSPALASTMLLPLLARCADNSSRLTRWDSGLGQDRIANTFSNQALNTLLNYACRSVIQFNAHFSADVAHVPMTDVARAIVNRPAAAVDQMSDIYITDPPYADAVHYHEITEFFIAWLRKNPAAPFNQWTWDSRRPLAIKGDGEDFRREMVAAYKAMATHMPDNGVQIVMFTHQSGSVWADMAQIFWGAGLQVQAAWYIATETTSELKKGGYVQGTVILVLRKRRGNEAGYEDEIAQEVRAEVAHQIDTLVGLNQSLKGAGRIENLFEDADLQMAGYAAALRVLTGYTRIDGRDMTAEAVRPRKKGEKGFVERIIDFAVQVANEHMVPDGLTPRLWQQLSGTERFYLKMIDLEAAGLKKLDNYQNLARAFRVPDYNLLMGDVRPNAARIKRADDFKHRIGFDILDFGQGIVRTVLYGIYQLSKDAEGDVVLDQVRGMIENYYRRRDDLVEVAEYIAAQRGRDDDVEGRHAAVLANLIRNERL